MTTNEDIQIFADALKTQFTAEREKMSRGWFMIIVGLVIMLFAILLVGSHTGFLVYMAIPVSITFASLGWFEIRRVRHLLLKITIDAESGERERIEGAISEHLHRGGKGEAGRYYWKIGERKVRVAPSLWGSFADGTALRIVRGKHSKTILEVEATSE